MGKREFVQGVGLEKENIRKTKEKYCVREREMRNSKRKESR